MKMYGKNVDQAGTEELIAMKYQLRSQSQRWARNYVMTVGA